MLYGRIVYPPNPNTTSDVQYFNVGDVFQTLAWDRIYAQCGIPAERIVNVSRYDLRMYNGEDVLLPMNGWFGIGRGADVFPLSPRIRPLFIGYHNIHKDDARRLPGDCMIGCRDEKTLDSVAPFARDAFVTGCMTILLERRAHPPQNGRAFIVDVSARDRKAIPPSIAQQATLLSHEVRFDLHNPDGLAAEIARTEDVARRYLDRYRDEASLVITSRLHCALVCIAIGVPVVLMRSRFDERYAFVDRLIPLYDAREFDRIRWDPQPVDVQDLQALTMRMACSAVLGSPDMDAVRQLHAFYQSRDRHVIETPFMVRAYDKVRDVSPTLADFIREKILFRFTIAQARGQGGGDN